MALTSRKSPKNKLGIHSKARPRSASKQSGGSRDARREEQARRASILLKYVSDLTRLEVILILAEGEQNVGTLCDRLGQSQPAVSHHLALLRLAGIITPRREGAKNFYDLTDTGWALAEVVKSLVHEDVTERPAGRPRPTWASSPSLESARQADEELWSRMNRRRAELIFRKNRGQLNDAECSEMEHLQALSRSRMQREFPGPTLIDEKLKRIEEYLRGVGVENT